MKSLYRLLISVASAAFFIASAHAQGTVTLHAFAIGKGAGVTGYTSLLCGSAQLAVGQAAADPICQTITGDVTLSAGGVTAIGANKVTNAQIRQSAALSLVGNATNALANVADIPAVANSSCVFLENAGTLICAAINTANIANSAVTYAKIQNVTASRLLGNPTGGAAAPSEISLGATFAFSGSTLQTVAHTGDVTSSANSFAITIAANAVTNAKMATMAANTVKANATGSPATPTDVLPAPARSSSLLNIDSFTGHGDSVYTILATDRTVGTNAAFTASRTWTLPAANAVNPGQEIIVADFQGTVTGVNTLVISRAGADTINGGTAVTISAANGAYLLKSDGVSRWTAQALGSAGAGGVSSVTCGTGLSGGTITTSGTCALALNNATFQSSNAGLSPTATSSTTQVMMGMGSTCKITPVYSGRIRIAIYGNIVGTAAGTLSASLYSGSGAAPANGAAVTGTKYTAGNAFQPTASSLFGPFLQEAIITGLSPGTSYWFDMAVAANSGGGTASIASGMCNAMEF